jgi:lyso-ornithine lipid O-acyltransferase
MGSRIRHDRLPYLARPATTDSRSEEPILTGPRELRESLRSRLRFVFLLLTLLSVLLRFLWQNVCRRKLALTDRAAWMHDSCVRVLRCMSLTLSVEGSLPTSGLVVSNHLSYLDILLHAAAGSRIFISKSEVRSWPLFGWLARCGGTIFLVRGDRSSATETAIAIEYALRSGITVVFFPEGTSTDGTTLLPFHTFLFEPAVEAEALVTAAALSYEADDAAESELCYFGDVKMAENLLDLLGRKNLRGRIRFDGKPRVYANRKVAANDCWERVARLRLRASVDDVIPDPRRTLAGGIR